MDILATVSYVCFVVGVCFGYYFGYKNGEDHGYLVKAKFKEQMLKNLEMEKDFYKIILSTLEERLRKEDEFNHSSTGGRG